MTGRARSVVRGGGALLALLSGCITRPMLVPYPCLTIDEVPMLHQEMVRLRQQDDLRHQLTLEPETAGVRAYAKAASIKCAGDRELGARGYPPARPWWKWWGN